MFELATAAADTNGWDHMNGWGGGWMWLWGVSMMVLFVVLIVWLVRVADGTVTPRQNPPRDPAPRAREILAERYATGEITTAEYRERVSELQ